MDRILYGILWMFFAVIFDIFRVSGITIKVDIAIVVRIIGRCSNVRFVIWEIAKAAPVLDFWKRIRVMNEIDITIVLIEPRRIRNCSRVDLPEISDAMIAAWEAPRPGKSEQIGETKIVARVGFMIWDFDNVSFSVFCFGRIVFDFME